MQLYSRAISPFAARVRISIAAKNLPIRIIDNPDVGAIDFAKRNPLRRVPVLILDDGSALPESDTIVEYLEDNFPAIPLRPNDPRDRAQVRLLARVAELYVFPAVVPIFTARAAGDIDQVNRRFDTLDNALANLAAFLGNDRKSWRAFGDKLTTADGALAPFLFYIDFLGKACERDLLMRHPTLQQFWEGAKADAILAPVIDQMLQAMVSVRQRSHS